MASKPRSYIPPLEAAYIEALIRDLDSTSRKIGLQRLSQHYRRGRVLMNPAPVRVELLGLLYDESDKVRRWALNSLALVGGSRDAPAIVEAIHRFRDQPDLLHAGVAALAAVTDREDLTRLLVKQDLPLEGGLLLSVGQRSTAFDKELQGTHLDIDKADPADLRMGAILVGLDRAPKHLFSTKHPTRVMIGELNQHPDPLVAQYSVWATVENPLLTLGDLKLALRDLEAQPANVRGWVYRLIASSQSTAERHIDILQTGSRDPSADAREGLAAGLRGAFSQAIENLVVNWFLAEQSDPVRQRLLEHMAAVGDESARYGELVVRIYEAAGEHSLIRSRLEAAARGTNLYTRLKVISLDAERRDLFETAKTKAVGIAEGYPQPDSVRVLIVTALPLELAAVVATLDRHQKIGIKGDPNIYHVGTFTNATTGQERAVLVCQSGMGKVNASTAATNALRSFPDVEHIIMCGIAGGCPNAAAADEHVRLGDIVISGQGIIEYDFVKQTAEEKIVRSYPQRPSRPLTSAADALRAAAFLGEEPWEATAEKAINAAQVFARPAADRDVLRDNDGNVVKHPEDPQRKPGLSRLHVGVIATADTLQKDPEARDSLRDKYGARAIEMEASGMQNAAWAAQKDVFVVRGVCDYCDAFKDDAWHGYAAIIAAAFTRSLVEAMPAEWFP